MEAKDFECFSYASSNVVGPFLREAKVLNPSLTLACPFIIASTFFAKIWKISSEYCLKIPDLIFKNKSCWWWRNALEIANKRSIPDRGSRIFKHLQTILSHFPGPQCPGQLSLSRQMSPSWAVVSCSLMGRCLLLTSEQVSHSWMIAFQLPNVLSFLAGAAMAGSLL